MNTPVFTRVLYINGRPQPDGGGGGGASPGGGPGLLDWRDSVLDKDLTTPPGGPPMGRYIIASPAAGAWAGHENDIASGNGVVWIFEVPNPGFATYVEDEGIPYIYDGANWNSTQLIGQRIRIRNETGGPLLKGATGKLLVSVGFSVPENAYLVDYAEKTDPAFRPAIAVLDADLPDGTTGTGLVNGVLRGVDTTAFALTDQLVLGDAGAIIRPPPDTDPFVGEIQNIGSVIRVSAVDGAISILLEGLLPITSDVVFDAEPSLGRGVDSGFAVTRAGGRDVSVASGIGFVTKSGLLTRLIFGGETVTVTANSMGFLYINATGMVSFSASLPNLDGTLVLANVRTNAGSVVLLSTHQVEVPLRNASFHRYKIDVVGPTAVSGCITTINGGDPLSMDVDTGVFYITENRKTVPATVGVTFSYWYRDGSGGETFVTGQTQIDKDKYDDASGTLAALPAGKWKKDALYTVANNDGTGVEYHVQYAQQFYDSQAAAESGNLPVVQDDLRQFALRTAGIVIKKGDAFITSIVDERPFIGQLSSGSTATTDHGSLSGLADDDHPQYVLADGTRPFTGDQSFGGNDIVSVGLVDGVDVSAHGLRHRPGGADATPTAAAGTIAVGDASAEGVAAFMARSDHTHAVPAPPAPANVTKAAASAGVATTVARADHKHDVSTAVVGIVSVGDVAAEGAATTLARSDHTHAVTAPPAPANVTKAAASAGAAATVARSDHKHDVSTAAAIDLTDSTNAEGTATTLARSDHTHSHGARGGGTLHALATALANGFLSAADFSKLAAITAEAAPAVLTWGAGSVTATTTTRYLYPGYSTVTAQTAVLQYRVPRAGKIRKLRVRHNGTAGNGSAIVYTLRVNGVASTLTASVASTAVGGVDNTHSVTVADDDLIDIEVTKAASVGTSPSDILVTVEFAAA
jgi:hypothetical protein